MGHMSIALQQAMDSLEHAHTSLAHSRQERTQLVTAALRALAHQRNHLLKVLEDSIQQDSSDPTSPALRLTTAASHELTVVPLGTAALRVHPILHGSASLPELPAIAAAIATSLASIAATSLAAATSTAATDASTTIAAAARSASELQECAGGD